MFTPTQPEGPFYPTWRIRDRNTDLTRGDGITGQAAGRLIYIGGQVRDENAEPWPEISIEIWQACASGRYNHVGDEENAAPLDPGFRYWGQALTDADGRYAFKTIVPGSYPAGEGWVRPPHIHFKVSDGKGRELITQMYFAGHELNASDLILRQLAESEQKNVMVELSGPSADMEPHAQFGEFNIILRRG